MKTAEEILKKHNFLQDASNDAIGQIVIAAMEEYASQRSELTDEEIKTHAKEVFVLANLFSSNPDLAKSIIPILEGFYIDGAKWVRDRQKGGKP